VVELHERALHRVQLLGDFLDVQYAAVDHGK
jgi:hypothetical protein